MTDRQDIDRLQNQVSGLSSEIHNLQREFSNFRKETIAALRWLKRHIEPEGPPPGPAVSVMLEAEPLSTKEHE